MIVTQTYCDQNTPKTSIVYTHLTIDMHLVHGILRILKLQPTALSDKIPEQVTNYYQS